MNEPNINETAFDCPYCGAFTTQHWHFTYSKFLSEDGSFPRIPNNNYEKKIQELSDLEPDKKKELLLWSRKMRTKLIFADDKSSNLYVEKMNNLFLSRCYNCDKWAVWVNEDLIHPPRKFGSLPNQDLPDDVIAVVEEARSIIDLSPKGAAALLRLAIQMLCKHLGQKGENLNDDIADLVLKGLNSTVQKSLDIVRVVGNESVHPGVINVNDDKVTATGLLDLVNIIAEQMITQPKHVEDLYNKLPVSKRKAIEKRDKKK